MTLTVYHRGPGSLGGKHHNKADSEALAIGPFKKHVLPRDFVFLVDDVLLLNLFELPDSEGVARVVFVAMEFLNDAESLFLPIA